jgi:hypothetical protein
MDHAPVVALPPTLAPTSEIATGVADSQAFSTAPGVTVAAGLTFIVLVALTAGHAPGIFVVNVITTGPE